MTGSNYLDEADRWRKRCADLVQRLKRAEDVIYAAADPAEAPHHIRMGAKDYIRDFPPHDAPTLGDESPGMLTW